MSSMSLDSGADTGSAQESSQQSASSVDSPTDNASTNNDEQKQTQKYTFGISNRNAQNNVNSSDSSDANGPQCTFGTTATTNSKPILFGVPSDPNPNNNDQNTNSNGNTPNNNDTSNRILCSFGVAPDPPSNDDTTASTDNTNTFTFGVPPAPSTAQYTFGTGTTANGATTESNGTAQVSVGVSTSVEGNTPSSFGTPATANHNSTPSSAQSQPSSNDTTTPFSFGVPPTSANDSTPSSNGAAPSSNGNTPASNANGATFDWKPKATGNDPFAKFNAKNEINDVEMKTHDNDTTTPSNYDTPADTATTTNTNTPPTQPTTTVTDAGPPPSPPVIPDGAIDEAAKAAFLELYRQQTQGQWCCNTCNNFNPNTTNICESCDARNMNAAAPKKAQLIQTPCKISSIQFGISSDNDNDGLYSYYETLNRNGEILKYDGSHPVPRYFPYQHEDKAEELKEEGPDAWMQFDDDDDEDWEEEEEDDKEEEEEEDETDPKVRTYREYIQRRNVCKQQITEKRVEGNAVMIAMTGDGSMGGQLGVGNGSVTQIPNNIAPFPFILDCDCLANKQITSTATGIMSTAVVTSDNEIYVWGLNDKSELTINPHNSHEVDVGDDDDQLSLDIAWDRLFTHYSALITDIYKGKNPEKLEKPRFVHELLMKRKLGKLKLKFASQNTEIEGVYMSQTDQIQNIMQQFEQKCRFELSKKELRKKPKLKCDEEVNIEQTADRMQQLYIKICDRYDIPSQDRLPLFIPKATDEEMKQRRAHKLNPYKYTTPDKISDEDSFQGSLSCSYWTPAQIRLPYKMVVKQVSLGGTHMVVLDTLGRVWSSGTFMSDGPIGHHYDSTTKRIVRYQRTLKAIEVDESGPYQRAFKAAMFKSIASGANHFLMLDALGNIWKMGVSKLGQRWCPRNKHKYLSPQPVCPPSTKNRTNRIKVRFKAIACGNHHNVAISRDGELYAWGQNIWQQCGFTPREAGYGNVIDQPRCVPFYKAKRNVNDTSEMDVRIEPQKINVQQVVAGEHMTIALDEKGDVWTCGRNACGALGRKTRSEGVKDYGSGQKVKTEVKPDVMRQVTDLKRIKVDWIGCGSVVWFAHNSRNGAVYSYGDASSGRAGIGQWKYARGRPVFDEYNLDTNKYKVTSANGGSDHVIFTIRPVKKIRRRHTTFGSNANSRESSVSMDEGAADVVIDNNHNNNNNNVNNCTPNNNHNSNSQAGCNYFSKSNRVPSRTTRKRKLADIQMGNIEEEEEMDSESLTDVREPERKRMKLVPHPSPKPPLNETNHKSAPK